MTGTDTSGHASPRRPGQDLFATDHEIGPDLARVEWSATPLGEPESWPQSLRTAVSMLLASRFAMWMAWGPELTFFCNAAYRHDTLGGKYPWALGRPASQVWSEIWDDIGPRIDTVLATGQATWDEGLLLFLERADYPEETYHTFSYSPLRADDGAVVGMLCVVSEETDRVIGERRMATLRDLGSDPSVVRNEEETLAFAGQQLGRNLRDLPFTLTYLYDDQGDPQIASTTGLAPGGLIADLAALWPAAVPARGESIVVPLAELETSELPVGDWPEPPTHAFLAPLLRQGDRPYGFLVAGLNRYRPLDDGYRGFLTLVAGHVAAGIESARSYQAQQRRADELAELDRAKTAFFSNISHEFRTPLTLIMAPLNDLRQRSDDPRLQQELEVIHRNSLRLGKLVNSLLDFSRIEAGRMQAQFEPVDLSAVTAELASVFRSAIERAELEFEVDCPTGPRSVRLDRGLWEKVVLNLLSNALKFTFTGTIRISVAAETDTAVVTVADTGVGVPADEMPRLFERFHRIENARSRSHEGSGIGLALVKELVELHGGTISSSSVEHQGTTFTIRIPYGPDVVPHGNEPGADASLRTNPEPFVQEALRWLPNSAGADEIAQLKDQAAPANETARILVADDNADMREYLARLLTDAGHQVTLANDGQYALEAALSTLPELVISDVMMPRLDGLQLVAALRDEPRTAGTPVLLLSARAGQEASILGLEAGADDYLVKPFSAAELLARVQTNVRLARLRNHHARWRTALVDSLQEAFFVCDADGAVVEINSAFEHVLGFGAEGLPYPPVHPWWPSETDDPDGHQQVAQAFDTLMEQSRGSYTIPVRHRDGRRLWVAAAFNAVNDPETDRRMVVGTFRDVTAEHYVVQRENALARLSLRLSESDTVPDALAGILQELEHLWQASLVIAAVFDNSGSPSVTATGLKADWDDLPVDLRQELTALQERPLLTPVVTAGAGLGISLDHPEGTVVLAIDPGRTRPLTDEDQTLLALLAGRIGQGLHRVHQIQQQREAAIALQRAILGPSQLPAGFAVRYQPAASPLKVGGDWYDTVELMDGRIGIVVGDCVGRGLEAAAVMGQLRSACRALLLQDTGPAQTLTALDRFAATIPGADCSTVFCGVLDPQSGRLVYSSAGHPPALLGLPDGSVQPLDGGGSIPLAVRPEIQRPEAEYVVPARATLLLYTDGLVERRRESLDAGMKKAAEALLRRSGDPMEELATGLMTDLAPSTGYEDDVALLVYRHPGPLDLAVPAEFAQLAPLRATLRSWLQRSGLQPPAVQNVLVAAGEACANAMEHGCGLDPAQRIQVSGSVTADDIQLKVADGGRWRQPRPVEDIQRGRGLALMRGLVNRVTVTTGTAGTTVNLQTRITS
ncbi:SpoIIE family protein phosphatase [Kribbella sp. NPDC056861]|uniref:SpoIIE family protein phosphatase n=1 Tax=Kribbella sp. NPDC056861 TaxID=3154857 RepID=UPI00343BFBEC